MATISPLCSSAEHARACPARVIDQLQIAAMRINGLIATDVESEAGKSEVTGKGGSDSN